MDRELPGDVIAAQFAGGRSIARLADEWECDAVEVESAIRVALLAFIPRRDGGLKVSRAEERASRSEESETAGVQGVLEL